MNSVFLVLIAFFGYIVAYKTYGKWIADRILGLKDENPVPSKELSDGVDYVPTKRHILLGHHFTTIAGTGPIVGPAIGVIWGWVPAFLWVVLGPIFMGAVHDFMALAISARSKGSTLGEMTRGIISNRVGIIFLLLIQFLLWIVIAVFGLIIGILFDMYPQSVFPVWMEIPIALWLGYMIYNRQKKDLLYSIMAIIMMYSTIWLGLYLPIKVPAIGGSTVITWIIILYVYVYFASTLPVHRLLQPRDYINSHELLIAMGLLLIGVFVGHPKVVAPAFHHVSDAPPLFPMLFITIACGAISGFHSLASSGTTVKQLEKETDALPVGYGGMLLEGSLAVLIIVAVTAGIGMYGGGTEAFTSHYSSWLAAKGLGAKLKAVIDGSANLMKSFGVPLDFARSIMAVFIVSFASTTLDSATRIQRFGLQELLKTRTGTTFKPFKNRFLATLVVVVLAFALCMVSPGGKGALVLWPVFGALNQLLAGLALLVATVYLAKRGKPIWVTAIPMVIMLVITLTATSQNLIQFIEQKNELLIFVSLATMFIAVWMIIEGITSTVKSLMKKEKEEMAG